MLAVSLVKVHMFTSQVHLVVSEVKAQVENFDTGGNNLHIMGVKVSRLEKVCPQSRE